MQQVALDIQRKNAILLKILVLLILILSSIGIFFYSEKDPLIVEYDPDIGNETNCNSGKFTITRLVSTDIPLNVSVREIYIPINNANIQYTASSVNYPLDVSHKLKVVFQKIVPDFIPNGEYLYTPEAHYYVNPLKTVVKKLPYEKVTINCKR